MADRMKAAQIKREKNDTNHQMLLLNCCEGENKTNAELPNIDGKQQRARLERFVF